MMKLQDFFTKESKQTLIDPTNGFFGEAILTYEFTRNRNIVNLTHSNSFNVRVKMRVLIPGIGIGMADGNPNGYQNYPVYLKTSAALRCATQGVSATLKKMFPKTLNSSVETNTNTSDGTTASRSNEHTNGSSSSNVNTFGVQIGGGAFGDIPTFNVGVDYSHSWESSHSQSTTAGTGSAQDHQAASGSEMSIKDWSSYGTAKNLNGADTNNTIGEVTEWVWAQSYPWDIVQFHQLNGTTVQLPDYVLKRLQINETVNDAQVQILQPPSHLSLLGLDFTMMAEWEVTFPGNLTSIEEIDIHHDFTLIKASHTVGTNIPTVTLNTAGTMDAIVDETSIELGQYALQPLKASGLRATGIGFKENLFDVVPTSTQDFKIVSIANDLLVTGSGFDGVMSTSFSNTDKSAEFTITFKTLDIHSEFSLLLRHWIGDNSGPVTLTCLINGLWTEIIKVDGTEGHGGKNNNSSIALRNTDLTSVNFHDYVVPGTNTIVVTVTPDDPAATNNLYVLSALGIDDNS
ncbi:hypothetical protein ACFOY8_12045 [Thalassospira xianhensis]|uniref:Uncharacterized protein n=1 Tax=Thalassospira xianhensis MCCC 1A02616 TaxID=1177929 RepID=A0A367U7T8_9PROT|nr:hypothetical protein [Thalassospira xianhensis]RCK04159.1 hypothetical protein TH5_21540 [Thalassospira xianhensis MCCC 1A02616]